MILEREDNLDLWVKKVHQQNLGHLEIRELFIAVLSATTTPMKAEEIRKAVQLIRPETGRATVYRFIDKLIVAGLLRRVHGYQNCRTYMPIIDVHQPLLLCTDCGQVSYLSQKLCASINQVVEATKQVLDNHVISYQLQFFEVCINCQTNES